MLNRSSWRHHLPLDLPQALRDQSPQSHTQIPKAPGPRDSHLVWRSSLGTRTGQAPDPQPGATLFHVAGQDTYLPFRPYLDHAQLGFLSAPSAYGQSNPNPVVEPGWQLIAQP